MKALFGSIVVAGSGSIGGHTISRNRGGQYIRTKVTPLNPQTVAQTIVRAAFGTFSQAWKGLTTAQRTAWLNAVNDWKTSDIFSNVRVPSGSNLFVRLNSNLAQIGVAMISSPLANAGCDSVIATTLTYAVGTPALSLALSGGIPATVHAVIYATPPMSAGKSYSKNLLRKISLVEPSATSPVNILAAYNTKFGNVGVVGQKIVVGIKFINSTSGASSPMQTIATVSAA